MNIIKKLFKRFGLWVCAGELKSLECQKEHWKGQVVGLKEQLDLETQAIKELKDELESSKAVINNADEGFETLIEMADIIRYGLGDLIEMAEGIKDKNEPISVLKDRSDFDFEEKGKVVAKEKYENRNEDDPQLNAMRSSEEFWNLWNS